MQSDHRAPFPRRQRRRTEARRGEKSPYDESFPAPYTPRVHKSQPRSHGSSATDHTDLTDPYWSNGLASGRDASRAAGHTEKPRTAESPTLVASTWRPSPSASQCANRM